MHLAHVSVDNPGAVSTSFFDVQGCELDEVVSGPQSWGSSSAGISAMSLVVGLMCCRFAVVFLRVVVVGGKLQSDHFSFDLLDQRVGRSGPSFCRAPLLPEPDGEGTTRATAANLPPATNQGHFRMHFHEATEHLPPMVLHTSEHLLVPTAFNEERLGWDGVLPDRGGVSRGGCGVVFPDEFGQQGGLTRHWSDHFPF